MFVNIICSNMNRGGHVFTHNNIETYGEYLTGLLQNIVNPFFIFFMV